MQGQQFLHPMSDFVLNFFVVFGVVTICDVSIYPYIIKLLLLVNFN